MPMKHVFCHPEKREVENNNRLGNLKKRIIPKVLNDFSAMKKSYNIFFMTSFFFNGIMKHKSDRKHSILKFSRSIKETEKNSPEKI